ncbi:hypothetical protein [Paenibacillus sp. OAS669]|uniref:hypothetical protein n=1 Tax=Paenibacillus sp. OAS669 TaxID=2663821 RepID=UPI001789F400|nr:hypothetical protein [Paenibacillus sp. OAS669]MBE1446275.1 hypothetical protein [Paenibacillus sp. OAS669]
MKKWALFICIMMLAACSGPNKGGKAPEPSSVKIELTNPYQLDYWKLALLPTRSSETSWQYAIEVQYTGDRPTNNVVIVYRVDTKEKMSGSTIGPDAKMVVSKLDPNERVTIQDLNLPLNTPIQVGVTWMNGGTIMNGYGTFTITEIKDGQ